MEPSLTLTMHITSRYLPPGQNIFFCELNEPRWDRTLVCTILADMDPES
jgi:hypothetical protein